MYKVGDRVKIKPKVGDAYDYMCSYVQEMSDRYAGKIATITSVEEEYYCDRSNRKFYNPNDTSCYSIDLDDNRYCWDCEIFEAIDDVEPFLGDFIEVNDSSTFLLKIQTPVVRISDKIQCIIEMVDEKDDNQTYKLSVDGGWWVNRPSDIYVDYETLFKQYKSAIFYSKIFGKMEISLSDNTEYPLLAKLSDGDFLELTSDFKYFKDSKSSII